MPTFPMPRFRAPLRLAALAVLAVLALAGAAYAQCPIGTDTGTECQITSDFSVSGTQVFGRTVRITGAGSVSALDATGFTLSVPVGDFIMEAGAEVSGDVACANTQTGAPITITLGGGNIDLQPGSLVHSNSCSGGFIQILTVAPGRIDVDGRVESVGSISGTGSGRPGGGPITIVAGCELVVSDAGVVSSRGADPGADLVHLEGCVVTIHGLVESTGNGHVGASGEGPNNPPNSCSDVTPVAGAVRRNPETRPGKPKNSTACVEVWSGTTLTIDATGTHHGEINADISFAGGGGGFSWIELFANGDITVTDGTGNDHTVSIPGGADPLSTFAVHANKFRQGTAGLVVVKTTGGSVSATGDAFQADDTRAGAAGGEIHIEAFLNVTLNTARVFARGDSVQSGGYGQGGQIGTDGQPIRAYTGTLSWTGAGGEGNAMPTGTDEVGTKLPAASRGVIVLQDCTAGPIALGGTSFPNVGLPATAPVEKAGACTPPPADFLPSYVTLPLATCADQCEERPRGFKKGLKFNDLNGDGERGQDEPGLSGWTIRAYQGNVLVASTSTGQDGTYTLALAPGTYTICEVTQAGWTQTFPTLVPLTPGAVSCAGLGVAGLEPVGYEVTLIDGQIHEGNDFGNTRPGTAECPEEPTAKLTRAVDEDGQQHGVPTYTTVQAAYDAAESGEVIGIFTNTTENIVLGGSKSLTITQCTTAHVFAADQGLPVWTLSSTGVLTVVGPDSVGGTVGWLIQTGGHTVSGVRASGATQFGIQIVGHGNTVSFNSLTGNAVGLQIEGDGNDVRGGTVSGNAGNGVQIAASGSGNTFRTANVQSNGGHGIAVAGSSNIVKDNARVDSNASNGIWVSGAGNTIKNNKAGSDAGKGNGLDGILVTGAGNTLESNKLNANGGAGVHVGPGGTGTKLKLNLSNQGSAGSSKENGGPEYQLEVGALNLTGNKADNASIPSAAKCPTFPAAGDCE